MTDKEIKRREVVKAITSSVAITSIGTSKVAADGDGDKSDISDLEEKYAKVDRMKRIVADQAESVLDELHEEGVISNPSIDVFNFEEDIGKKRIAEVEKSEGRKLIFYSSKKGGKTAHIILIKESDNYSISLHVKPEAGEEYALVEERDSNSEFVIDPNTEAVKLSANPSSDDLDAQDVDCPDYDECDWDDYCYQDGHRHHYARVYHTCTWDHLIEECTCYESDRTCIDTGCSCTSPYFCPPGG